MSNDQETFLTPLRRYNKILTAALLWPPGLPFLNSLICSHTSRSFILFKMILMTVEVYLDYIITVPLFVFPFSESFYLENICLLFLQISQPACQPASLPACQPASQPACQPASQPASLSLSPTYLPTSFSFSLISKSY